MKERDMTDLFFEYLDKNVPAEGGCAVFETQDKVASSHFIVAVRVKISNGDMFLLNGRFYYDYSFMFEPDKWKVIYKKVI